MNRIPKPIIRAAKARAQGNSWEAAAEAAGWTIEGVESWISRHEREWARELGRARREARDAACDEAVAILRQHLRKKTDDAVIDAAKIITARFARTRNKPRRDKPESSLFLDQLAELPEGRQTRVDQHLEASEDENRATPDGDRPRSR